MKKGFTLVEIAIVLVIIGLLVGGVLEGRELINQSHIRSEIRQLEGLRKTLLAFDLKYHSAPGDYEKATSFLGAGTVNGNGDNSVQPAEFLYYWQHLSMADLIDDDLAGGVYGSVDLAPGTNVPDGKMKGTCLEVAGPADNTDVDTENFAVIGALYNAASCTGRAFTSDEASSLDQKLDDNLPNSGLLIGLTGMDSATSAPFTTACAVTVSGVTNYNLANTTDTLCSLRYFFRRDI